MRSVKKLDRNWASSSRAKYKNIRKVIFERVNPPNAEYYLGIFCAHFDEKKKIETYTLH